MKHLVLFKPFRTIVQSGLAQIKKSRMSVLFTSAVLLLSSLLISEFSYAQELDCKSGCTSNDVQIKRAFVRDANGNTVTCIHDGLATGYLYLELSTKTPRIGVSIQAKIVDANDLTEVYALVGECFGVTLSSGTIVKFTNPISWTCGDPIALKDTYISWGTGNTNFCTGSDPQCSATPSKCWRQPLGNIIQIDLTPCTAGSITLNPSDQTICAGSNTSFSAAYTSGSGTTTIKWQRSLNSGSTWTDISATPVPEKNVYSGFTTTTLTLTGATATMNGYKYQAVVTSTSPSVGVPPCSVTSTAATLTVASSPATPLVTATQPSLCNANGSLEVTNPVAGLEYTFNYTGLSTPDVRTYASGTLIYTNIPAGSNPTLSVSNGVCPSVSAASGNICPTTPPVTVTTKNTEPKSPDIVIPVEVVNEPQDLNVKAYPNPFSDRVRFVINTTEPTTISLNIYNTSGQLIKQVYQGSMTKGVNYYEVSLPAVQVNNLVYVLKAGNRKYTGRLLQISNK